MFRTPGGSRSIPSTTIKRNFEEGKLARGGSTITQQLAKNLYLSTEKSFLRKLKEYFIAQRLEKELSKYRIYHLYLNIIEFGPGIFGVEAASRYYFKKSVKNLNLEEMVRLTAIIPRPLITNPKGHSGWLKWKCKWILRKLALYNYIDQATYDANLMAFE
ncbi:MAG: transglycosylase domain-containing protein [Calditrichaceae bacterium]